MEEAWLSEVEPEVVEAARELGIRLEVRSERGHLWIALLYALEPLDEGWSKQTDARGRAYFYNAETGESRWRPPAYEAHRALLEDQHAASRALDEQVALDESMRLAFHQLLTAGFFRVDERTIMFS